MFNVEDIKFWFVWKIVVFPVKSMTNKLTY